MPEIKLLMHRAQRDASYQSVEKRNYICYIQFHNCQSIPIICLFTNEKGIQYKHCLFNLFLKTSAVEDDCRSLSRVLQTS